MALNFAVSTLIAVSGFAKSNALPLATAALSGLAAIYFLLWATLQLTQDRDEPKLVATSIPFLSPIIGMVRWNMGFYSHMRDKYRDLPIYTLRVPGVRLYVINSTNLIPVVQRQWRTLLFPPIQARAAELAMAGSPEAIAIMRHDMVTEKGFVNGMIKATHPGLSRGPELDDLNSKSIGSILKTLEPLAKRGPTTIRLWDWISREIMRATTDGIYGPQNPMRDTKNYESWERYQPTLMFLLLGIFPLWIFRAGIKGRDHLAQSFARYHAQGGHTEGSGYIKRWIQYFTRQGIPDRDIGKFLVGSMYTVAANTIPTTFWVVYRIFSDPAVLEDCRKEVAGAVREQDGVFTIDASYLLNSCPIMLSTYHEVFRVHGMAHSVRVASEDQLLDNKYLIKKGGLIMISGRAQHNDPLIWGDNAGEFYSKRFVKGPGTKRHNPVAFRGFGGGTTLCPGRHYATTEILLFATLLLLRFDIQPVERRWIQPSVERSSQAEAMEQPDTDIDVELRPRPGSDRSWRVSLSGYEETAFVAEDIEPQKD